MAKKIRIPRDGWPAIALIGKHYHSLPMLKTIAEELGLAKATPERISIIYSERTKLPLSDAQKIVTQLLGFHALRATLGINASQLYERITISIDDYAPDEWKNTSNITNWRYSKTALVDALGPDHPFNILQKRTRLTYEHQNVLYDVSVITDVRPTFDDSARDVLELSVTHVLNIEYNNGVQHANMYVTLDSADVAKLKAACERAQIKEATLKTKLKEFGGAIIVAGEETEDE